MLLYEEWRKQARKYRQRDVLTAVLILEYLAGVPLKTMSGRHSLTARAIRFRLAKTNIPRRQ